MSNDFNINLYGAEPRATSGTVVNNFRTGYRVQVAWTVNSQNIANNTSNVTFKAQLVSTGSGYSISSSATKNGSLTINGTKYSFTFTASLSGGQTKTVFTKTLDIPHNSDGTKTCSIATTLGINVTLSGTYWGNVTASGSGVFNNIPRVSTFSVATNSMVIGSTVNRITINKSSSGFNHKIYYKFGSINVCVYDGSGTTYDLKVSESDCSQIPNSASGTATITVETWNGSTKLGQNSTTVTMTVPDSVKPSISGLTAELVANGVSTSLGYLQNKSQCKLTITGASGKYGSSITNYSISGGGYSSSAVSTTTPVLTTSGTVTFTAQVTDSRGRKSDAKTVSISVKAYTPPTILEIVGERCLVNGEVNEDGTYVKLFTRYSYNNLGGSNKLTARVGYRKNGVTAFTYESETPNTNGAMIVGKASSGGAIETTSGYEIRLFLQDDVSKEVAQSIAINTSFVTMDFKKGGKGIAIGKASETDNLFEVAMDTNIIGNLTVNGKPVGADVDWNNVPSMNVKGNIGMTGYIKLPNSGGSWLNGATNGNIRGYRQSTGAYHPIISQATSSNHKISLGGLGDEFGFHMYDANRTDNGIDKYFRFRLSDKTIHTDARMHIYGEWLYVSGNSGVFFSTHGGGWHMTDSTWLRAYGDKSIYTGGTIKSNNALESRYINSIGGNLDINAKGNTLFINANAQSGANLNINRAWSGTQGSEISIYNSKGKGWGYLGNSENSFYRVYGAGGSVSARESKYDIQKYDTELLYNYVKEANVYGYRGISDERDEDGNVVKTVKRQDMYLGCMVDELPTEAVFYDDEGGTGKAVDNYAYSTMIMGAVKHLQTKVETLEAENEAKDRKIEDLEDRLLKLEEMILNGNN